MTKLACVSLVAVLTLGFAGTTLAYGTQTKMTNCVANQILQDPACTPGAVLTTDKSVICISGYTQTVRNVTTATKKKVFKEYGIPWSLHSNYEVDHLISLELGGSNDISNLWPESYDIKDGSRTKDVFENYLHREVCAGRLNLSVAQREVSGNWLAYYQQWKYPSSTR